MSRYDELAGSSINKCVPDLHPVDNTEVADLCALVSIHPDLAEVWNAWGYGFFSTGKDRDRLTRFSNRLYPPDEIIETIDELRNVHGSTIPDLGTPFFEFADFGFFAVTPSGHVVDEQGDKISANMYEFFKRLLADVEFFTQR